MGKVSKRTVKFLRSAAKSTSKGGAKSGEGAFKKGGRKQPRQTKQDKDDMLEDMEVEQVISMKSVKNDMKKMPKVKPAAKAPEEPKGSVKR